MKAQIIIFSILVFYKTITIEQISCACPPATNWTTNVTFARAAFVQQYGSPVAEPYEFVWRQYSQCLYDQNGNFAACQPTFNNIGTQTTTTPLPVTTPAAVAGAVTTPAAVAGAVTTPAAVAGAVTTPAAVAGAVTTPAVVAGAVTTPAMGVTTTTMMTTTSPYMTGNKGKKGKKGKKNKLGGGGNGNMGKNKNGSKTMGGNKNNKKKKNNNGK